MFPIPQENKFFEEFLWRYRIEERFKTQVFCSQMKTVAAS